jgi:hypothetical protein
MTDLTIYKDRTFLLFGKLRLIRQRHTMKLPTDWSEMSHRQAIIFIRMLFFPTFKDQNTNEYTWRFKNRFLKYIMMDARDRIGRRYFTESDFFTFGDYPIHMLMDKIAGIFKKDAAFPAIKKILVKLTHFYLPGHNMQNSSFIEFAMAEEYYYQICKGINTSENITSLCATLVRPQRTGWWFIRRFLKNNGDNRIEYDSRTADQAAKLMTDEVTEDIKFYVFYYYKAVRKNLIELYPAIFQREDQGEADANGNNYRFIGALHQTAQDGAFGDWNACALENMHNILHYVNFQQDKAKEASDRLSRAAS